jgi:hypothetical protein
VITCSTQSNQRNSPLLRLRAKFRNRIYELAFAGETVYVYPGESTNANPIHLVQICKQIRHEASSLFYTRCTFEMSVKRYLKRALDFDRESREHAMATRGLAYLDDISQVVGLENSTLITSL